MTQNWGIRIPDGYWVLEHGHDITTTIPMYRRPRWLTRWALRVVFDIYWRDA
jgi:hypothetical protein